MDFSNGVGPCELKGLPELACDGERLLFNRFSSIRRSMTWLPLDAAAYTGSLVTLNRLAGQHGLDGCAEIATCDRLVVAGAALIELPMIGQTAISIKKIEFRSTGGAIGFRNILGLVVTEWKGKAQTDGHFLQPRWCIIGIVDGVIAADGDDPEIRALIVLSEPGQLLFHMHHIRTVPADEHDEHACLRSERVE